MGGEKVGIMGPNGAGKTTLLRLIAEQLLARRDLKAAYMPQDYADTLPLDRTPIDYLAPGGEKEEATVPAPSWAASASPVRRCSTPSGNSAADRRPSCC